MNSSEILLEGFGRLPGLVHGVLDGVSAADLHARPFGTGNSIAWLLWHLARVEDDHIAGAAGTPQLWIADGWAERFELPFPDSATGYGFSSAEVSQVRIRAPRLLGQYYDAVHERTTDYVRGLTESDLDRAIDESWDPPVTLGVRLVSVIQDCAQHAGQAAYVKGCSSGADSAA